MTLLLIFLGMCIIFVVGLIMSLGFSDMSKNEKLGHIIAVLFGIIFILTGIIYEMDYDKYPLVSRPVIYTQDTFVFERVKFKFEKPYYIIQYYYDTPWYISRGGKNEIECIKIKDAGKE